MGFANVRAGTRALMLVLVQATLGHRACRRCCIACWRTTRVRALGPVEEVLSDIQVEMPENFVLGFRGTHDYFGWETGTFPCSLHASNTVLCIREQFSDISTGCKNALQGSLQMMSLSGIRVM